jgi:hypothetical protein
MALFALADDLDRRGIRSKSRQLSNGRHRRGFLGVGALAYLLKNRFYVGEVALVVRFILAATH